MKPGYDEFFRKARVNAGVSSASSVTEREKSGKASPNSKVQFNLQNEESPLEALIRTSQQAKPKAQKRQQISSGDLNKERIHQLREKVKSKRAGRRRFPWKLVIGSLFGLLVAGGGLQYHEQIDQLLGKLEIGAVNKAVAADPKPATDRAPAAVDPKAAEKATEKAKSTTELSESEINHLKKLVQRKEQLDAREAELGRLETELATQKEELEKKLKTMDETRMGISTMLQERTTQDEAKVETLVQVYSTMKPAQAAKVLETLDEDLAVEIVGRMKKKNAAEVLNLMKPEKAQVFSEKFAGYRKK